MTEPKVNITSFDVNKARETKLNFKIEENAIVFPGNDRTTESQARNQ